uniref:Uncharacterized protein n=1 Tax=Arundo donax TaxID=35708 RepID=A0A0A9B844_ARUDO
MGLHLGQQYLHITETVQIGVRKSSSSCIVTMDMEIKVYASTQILYVAPADGSAKHKKYAEEEEKSSVSAANKLFLCALSGKCGRDTRSFVL